MILLSACDGEDAQPWPYPSRGLWVTESLKVKYACMIPLIKRLGWQDNPKHNKQEFYSRSPQPQMDDRRNIDKISSVKLYLAPILDMFNGKIISYYIFRKPDMEQKYDMLDKTFTRFNSLDGLILHSDQGWQYLHYGYRKCLKEHHIVQCMVT